jgi:molybdopterin/thiamine biosynthesis adenylyltransferase
VSGAQTSHGEQAVLVIGLGGLACPALAVLARCGVARFTLVDDDVVDASNLQRQTLYDEADLGRLKVEVAAERIRALSPHAERVRCTQVVDRFTPDCALALAAGHALILEGADNFATKFLAADTAKLSGVPVVQAGAVRFGGWALASLFGGSDACVRCVFEDIPREQPETCAAAGVLGPVVGVLGALQAALALELLRGHAQAAGMLYSYEALPGKLRRRRVARRADCPLCSGQILDLNPGRYLGACAA